MNRNYSTDTGHFFLQQWLCMVRVNTQCWTEWSWLYSFHQYYLQFFNISFDQICVRFSCLSVNTVELKCPPMMFRWKGWNSKQLKVEWRCTQSWHLYPGAGWTFVCCEQLKKTTEKGFLRKFVCSITPTRVSCFINYLFCILLYHLLCCLHMSLWKLMCDLSLISPTLLYQTRTKNTC